MITKTPASISMKVRHKGKCPLCKKRATRRTTLTQLCTPEKSDEQIIEELQVKAKEWESRQVYHEGCEAYLALMEFKNNQNNRNKL